MLLYIDPTTTATITQIVVGVVISLGVAFGVFRQKIFMFFKNMQVKKLEKKLKRQQSKEGTEV